MVQNLGINKIVSNKWANVDVLNIQQTTQEIFARSNEKTLDLNKVDLSKFNRQTRGTDLYSPSTSLEVQRQISMTNANLNPVRVDVSYLNSQAANQVYGAFNVTKNVEGKMTINVNENAQETPREVFQLPKSTEVFSTSTLSKDKRGGSGANPFAKHLEEAPKENVKTTSVFEGLNLLA